EGAVAEQALVVAEAVVAGGLAVAVPVEQAVPRRLAHWQDDEDGEQQQRRRQEQHHRGQPPAAEQAGDAAGARDRVTRGGTPGRGAAAAVRGSFPGSARAVKRVRNGRTHRGSGRSGLYAYCSNSHASCTVAAASSGVMTPAARSAETSFTTRPTDGPSIWS